MANQPEDRIVLTTAGCSGEHSDEVLTVKRLFEDIFGDHSKCKY